MASKLDSGSFRVINVPSRAQLKKVVADNGLEFAKGRAFYQITKPEIIQDYKKLVVRRLSDGKYITGEAVRTVLDIPKNKKRFKLDLEEIPDFQVFVQSTSHNRVVLPDSVLLYDIRKDGDEVENCDLL